jgi:uncharacterized membrane protein
MLALLQSQRDPGMKTWWFLTAVALALTACQSKEAEPSTDNAVQAEQAAIQASPWAQAEARGLAFRGIGTEPGWLIEVGSGAAPALHAELDYGERIVDVASAEAFGDGYRGSTGDGVAVELQIRRETCSDGMSDESYPAAIALTVGERSYQGCGRYLGE